MYSVKTYNVKNKDFNFIEVSHCNIKVTFMDYGATILSIFTPDKDNQKESILMAFDSLDQYINNDIYLNAIIGPTSGRIKNAEFTINNQTYQLDKNNQKQDNLHGGSDTFAFRFFDFEIKEEKDQTKVIFTYLKPKENSTFPGNVSVKIIYTVKENELLVEYEAETDEDTLLNLTNHAYFNLSGNLKNTVLDHELLINADTAMTLGKTNVPDGVQAVSDTFLDFREQHTIKDNYYEGIYQTPTKGIDHPYILNKQDFNTLCARLFDPVSMRQMDVYTTYPAVVVYSYNYPSDNNLLFDAKNIMHQGICFETQNQPNGINLDNMPSSILKKGDKYYHKTLFKFSVGGE